MSDTKLMTSRDLGKAICAHFGLSINKVKSDYRIKTEPDGLASINLTINLTPDDLSGIAREAAGDEPQSAMQELKIKVDASEAEAAIKAVADHINQVFRDGVSTLLDIAGNASAEMVKGEALALAPDPRLDEIVSLLKELVAHAKSEREESRAAAAALVMDVARP